jgi:5-methyltetrahydrofolate--homocysteine methyltransferase
MSTIEETRESVIQGQSKVTVEKTTQAFAEGIAPDMILHHGLIRAMGDVGRLFEKGVYVVPEMLIAACAMDKAPQALRLYLVAQGARLDRRMNYVSTPFLDH